MDWNGLTLSEEEYLKTQSDVTDWNYDTKTFSLQGAARVRFNITDVSPLLQKRHLEVKQWLSYFDLTDLWLTS